jgi:PTS system nitrogen regulatory IIA component
MQLGDFLDFDAINTRCPGGNKRSLLQQLANLPRSGSARSRDDPRELTEREQLGSTGFGQGVAIPHGKIEGLNRIVRHVQPARRAIDFKAIDGKPVDLVFLLLSPPDAGAEHLKALAAIRPRHPAPADA